MRDASLLLSCSVARETLRFGRYTLVVDTGRHDDRGAIQEGVILDYIKQPAAVNLDDLPGRGDPRMEGGKKRQRCFRGQDNRFPAPRISSLKDIIQRSCVAGDDSLNFFFGRANEMFFDVLLRTRPR